MKCSVKRQNKILEVAKFDAREHDVTTEGIAIKELVEILRRRDKLDLFIL